MYSQSEFLFEEKVSPWYCLAGLEGGGGRSDARVGRGLRVRFRFCACAGVGYVGDKNGGMTWAAHCSQHTKTQGSGLVWYRGDTPPVSGEKLVMMRDSYGAIFIRLGEKSIRGTSYRGA